MSPSKEKLARLKSVSKDLDEQTDSLNAILDQLEKELTEAKVSVSVWLEDSLDEEIVERHLNDETGETERERYLGWEIGYSKVGGDWHLAARTVSWVATPSAYGGFDYTATLEEGRWVLRDAPRHVRALAAPLLDKLLDAITQRATEYLENMKQAASSAEGK